MAERTSISRVGLGLVWLGLIGWLLRSTVLLRKRDASEFASVDELALVQIAFIACAAFGLLLSGRWLTVCRFSARTSLRAMLCYLAACVLSFSWSEQPAYSLYRATEATLLLLGMFAVTLRREPYEDLERQLLRFAAVVTVLLIYARLTPWRGLSMRSLHAVGYTVTGGMMFLYCLGELLDRSRPNRARLKRYGLFGLVCLIIGTSAGSYIGTLCGIAVIGWLRRRTKLVVATAGVAIVAGGLLAILSTDLNAALGLLFPGKSQEAISGGTGRFHMWREFGEIAMEHPVLGLGFGVVAKKGQLRAADPHNSFFAALLGVGLVGLSLSLWWAASLAREILSARPHQAGCVGLAAALAMGMVNSLSTHQIVLSEFRPPAFVFCAMWALLLLRIKRTDSTGPPGRRGPTPRANVASGSE